MFDVIIPTFKSNPIYLRLAIQSVLNQTCQDFQIYISEGAPPDHPRHSQKILEDINDNRIHILQQVGIGISDARNQAFKAGSNPYVCTLDSDDAWDIRKLEYLKLKIENSDEPPKMLWGAAQYEMEKDEPTYRAGYFEEWETTKPEHRWLRLYWMPLMTSTIVYERNSLEKFGGWNSFMTMGEDMEVNWKFMWHHPEQCIQCPVYLGSYRHNSESTMQGGESGHTRFNTSVIPNNRRFSAQRMFQALKDNTSHNPTPHWRWYWEWYEKVLHGCRASSNDEYASERTHPLHILQRVDGIDNGSKFIERPDVLSAEYLLNLKKDYENKRP
jgi:glycosyltransferase involved in cell wall biosynthesis|tara:strand:- start:856 stop:1839 length:984 start_codon:yes stop_codon:yes gene_type:complete